MGTTLDEPLYYLNSMRILARTSLPFYLIFTHSLKACQNDIRFPLFSLPENCSDGKITCITHDFKGKLPVGCPYYWCNGQVGFELLEAPLAVFILGKFGILFQQLVKMLCNLQKFFDEPPVEACMSKELSHSFHNCGGRKFGN